MGKITYTNDVNGNLQEVQGSDGRLNVSSRADGRGYYNSRDESESFTLVYEDANCSSGDYVAYIKNTKTDGKHMVIRSVGLNSDTNTAFQFVTVSGTPAGGAVAATMNNLNQAGVAKTASADAFTVVDSDTTSISGLTTDKVLDCVNVSANGHEEFRLQDQLRIGQDQAVAVLCKAGTSVSAHGVIFVYFE